MIHVQFFGKLTDIAETCEIESASRVSDLRRELERVFPELAGETFQIAVNEKIAGEDSALHAGDRVACLPPFAGG